MEQALEAVTKQVAEYTCERNMENENWQRAIAINGLLALDEEAYTERSRQLVDRAIETQTSEGQFAYGAMYAQEWEILQEWTGHASFTGIIDPAALGVSVLEFYERTNDSRYLEAAHRQNALFEDVDRTEDGGIPQRREAKELWVDGIYELCPFLARYGHITDNQVVIDDAAHQIEIQAKHLQDPHTGLFRHVWCETPNSFTQSEFWGRGNGWALAGILDTLEFLPDDHDRRENLLQIFTDLADALVERQDRSGFWHNTIDDNHSPLETSGTLMFAYGLKRAVDLGILSADRYETAAQQAIDVSRGVVTDDGAVGRVILPPGGPDAEFGVTSYGQGWFLLAANQFI